MSHFLIINTGGTIGMVDGPNGLEPKNREMEAAFSNIPALKNWQAHTLEWGPWSPLLDSSDLTPQHWYTLKETIASYCSSHKTVDGVLIIHGTDTLSYTAAALSFLTSNLNQTIVITGSMLPISHPETDAIANLNLALEGLLLKSKEVLVAVGEQLLPGSRVTKQSTSVNKPFGAPGWTATLADKPTTKPLTVTKNWNEPTVGVVTLHPGFPVDILVSMVNQPYRAIVINAYGNGHAADGRVFRQVLMQANDNDIPVFVRSQCLEGNVQFGLYASSSLFEECRAVSCGSMTLEAVVTKVQILCSEYDKAEDVVRTFNQPISREWQ